MPCPSAPRKLGRPKQTCKEQEGTSPLIAIAWASHAIGTRAKLMAIQSKNWVWRHLFQRRVDFLVVTSEKFKALLSKSTTLKNKKVRSDLSLLDNFSNLSDPLKEPVIAFVTASDLNSGHAMSPEQDVADLKKRLISSK